MPMHLAPDGRRGLLPAGKPENPVRGADSEGPTLSMLLPEVNRISARWNDL